MLTYFLTIRFRTFVSDPSATRKVTVLSVHPISSAPISESSRVEATRSGPFQNPNYHGCIYASMALNWLRVVGSLLRWRRMVGVLRRKDWSDDWHGQFGKFQGARLLWFNIALCSLQFRTLLAFRVAFQRFAHTSMRRTVLMCCECYTPTKKLNWYCDLAPFVCLWHPDYQHPLCSTFADLGHYCKKFCPGCACFRSFYPAENSLYHVMVSDISNRLSLRMHILLWISRTSVIVVLVLNQLVFHLLVLVIWGFVALILVYDAMLVMLPLRSLMLGLRSLVVCHFCQ